MTTTDAPTIYRATVSGRTLAAADDAAKGTVRAVVSAYGVKYRIGWALWHTIEPGAFASSIAEQPAIPLFWMHSWDWSEQMPVGDAQAEESDEENGLVVAGGLYVEEDPSVARLHRSVLAGAIREWSIGYRVLASRKDPDDGMHELVTEAELLEASLVLRGANPDTRTLKVASAAGEHGRTRITTPDGLTVETADPDLIARLLTPAAAPPPAAEPAAAEPATGEARLSSSAFRDAVRESVS